MGFEEDSVLLASPFAFITPHMPPRDNLYNQKTTAAMAEVLVGGGAGTPNSVVKKLTFERPPAQEEHISINNTFAISPTSPGQTLLLPIADPDDAIMSPPRPKHSPSHDMQGGPIFLAECPQCHKQFMSDAHVKSHMPFCLPRTNSVVVDLEIPEEPEWDLEITRFLSRVSHPHNLFRTTSELLLVEAAAAPPARTPLKSSSKGSLHSASSPPFCEEPSAIDGRQSPTFGIHDETATAEVFAEALRQADDMHSFAARPDTVQCENCGRRFGTAERLAPHARVCAAVFGSRAKLEDPKKVRGRREEPKTPVERSSSARKIEQSFTCANCGRVFRAEAAAEVHSRVCEKIFGKFTGLKTVKVKRPKVVESPAMSIYKTLRKSREFQRQSTEMRKVDASVSPVRWSTVADKYLPPPTTVHDNDSSDISGNSAYDPSRYSSSSSSAASTTLRSSLGRSLELQYSRLREQIKACTERLRDRSLSTSSFRAG